MTVRDVARVTLVVATVAFGACSWWSNMGAKQWPMSNIANVPAANGEVYTRKWDGRERVVEVKVKHLAPANQVVTGKTCYVVWFKSTEQNAPAQNMGVLTLSPDLEGSLTASTSFVDFDVLVTAEIAPSAAQPSENEIMRGQVRGPVPTS
jgi:hypothetical protein